MFGAIALRRSWKRTIDEIFAKRDIETMMKGWADDGVLDFGGTHGMAGRFVGKPQVRDWMTRWFAGVDELNFRVGQVSLARPWALGLTNTVMYEARVHERGHNGAIVDVEVLIVTHLRRGKVTSQKVYLFDETPELAMWGRRADGRTTGAA